MFIIIINHINTVYIYIISQMPFLIYFRPLLAYEISLICVLIYSCF